MFLGVSQHELPGSHDHLAAVSTLAAPILGVVEALVHRLRSLRIHAMRTTPECGLGGSSSPLSGHLQPALCDSVA